MPGFDDAATGFDDAIGFDASGGTPEVPGLPAFPVIGWGGVSLAVEVGFVVNEFIIGEGIIGTTLLGPDPEWTDVTQYVLSWSAQRGRQRSIDRSQTGTFSADLIATDGRFDPTNLSGPYVLDGATLVVPGRPVRVRAEFDGDTFDIWRGYADSWPGTWARAPLATGPAYAALNASGVFEWPAASELPAGPSQGNGELAGARVDRILDTVNWPTNLRQLDAGVTPFQATTLEGSVVDLLNTAAESDGGVVYEGADGAVVFLDRQSPFTLSRSVVSQATFGDDPATELPYQDVTLDYSKDLVTNDIVFGRKDSNTRVRIRDGESRRKYGPRSYENTELMNATDAQLVPLGVAILEPDAELRFTNLTVHPPHTPADLWPVILDLDLRSRITVTRRPASGNVITRDCFVESIAHSAANTSDWEVTLTLSAAEAFTTSPFIIGASLLGGTDVLVP